MGIIFKPSTRKGPVFLSSEEGSGPPTITLPDGRTITAVRGDKRGGTYFNEGNFQWVFDNDILGQEGATLNFNGKSQKLGNTNLSYRGNELGSLQESSKGAVGSAGGGYTGDPRFAPGSINGQGSYPAYLGGEFPSPVFSDYNPIKPAPYNYTDPVKFAEAFGGFNRNQTLKNYNLGKDLALDTLDTELAALKGFVPAASALKRNETSVDNLFNQYERTRQIDSTLPGVRQDLESQASRANTYASGKVPSSIEDRALEVSTRSRAADTNAAGGFGASSSAAQKASDLMSVEQRINLSKYGDELLGKNITQKQNLLLAPTEYSDAGNQVRVNPTVSPSQLISQELQTLNQNTLLSPNEALNSQTQQQQFKTNLTQQTNQFNASNQLQNSQFNAGTSNNFALTKFGYDVSYAGAVAGANQTSINTQQQLDLMKQYQDIFQQFQKQAQNANQIGAVANGIGALLPQIVGAVNSISNLFGSSANSAPDVTFPDLPTGDSPQATPDVGTGTDVGTNVPNFDIGYDPGTYTPGGSEPTSTPDFGSDGTSVPDFSTDFNTQGGALSARAKAALNNATKTMNVAGVSTVQRPGYVPVAVDTNGKPIYSDPALLQSNDLNLGKQLIQNTSKIIAPLGVLSKADQANLQSLSNTASSTQLINNLNDKFVAKDTKGFVNTLLSSYAGPISKAATSAERGQSGVNAAASAYILANNWGHMSDAQRSLAIASIGLSGFKTATGKDLSKTVLVTDPSLPGGKFTLGQGLSLFQAGYNTYNLVNNWNDLSTVAKVAGTATDVTQIANTAKSFGLLNSAGSNTAVNIAGDAAGVAGIALGAKQVANGWGVGGTKGAVNGALGGLGISAGLYALGATNPFLLGGIVAVSVLGDTIKMGKSGAQSDRDAVRSAFQRTGLADGNFQVKLADGSTADIGTDGHGGYHDARDPSKIANGGKKLQAWDIDYSNDLDYVSGMGGTTLSRLITGGKNTNIDQLGGQLGNAALKTVGFGKDLTPENFNKVQANMRAMYSQSGIKSKADAYALINKAQQEGRLSATDAVTAQQTANMLFDSNGYQTAQKLMSGRQRGAEVAAADANKPKPQVNVSVTDTNGKPFNVANVPGANKNTKITSPALRTKEEIKAANRQKFTVSPNGVNNGNINEITNIPALKNRQQGAARNFLGNNI